MNKARGLFYYFGRNEKHDYIATPMQSCLLAGRTGAGKTTCINSLLVRVIQECNPNEITIHLHDCKGTEFGLWIDSIPDNKFVPQFGDICLYDYPDTEYTLSNHKRNFQHLTKSLTLLEKEVERRNNVCKEMGIDSYLDVMKQEKQKYILFIIDEYQEYVNKCGNYAWFENLVSYIVSSPNTGVYIILSSQSTISAIPEYLVDAFPIKVTTPVNSDVSNLFLGCNVASMCDEQYGVVWVKSGKAFPIKLFVPFYPNTWIRKFIEYYSIKDRSVDKE